MSDRRGFGFGDVLMTLAGLVLAFALLYPTLKARTFRAMVDATTADVERLRSASTGAYRDAGAWPQPAAPGDVPSEVLGAFPQGTSLAREGYALEWRVFEFVERVPAPPGAAAIPADADLPPDSVGPVLQDSIVRAGAIVVHTSSDNLLAALLDRYGRESSFVRDTTWWLVLRPGPES